MCRYFCLWGEPCKLDRAGEGVPEPPESSGYSNSPHPSPLPEGKSIYTSFSGQKCFGERVQFFSNRVGIVKMRSLEKNLSQAFCFCLISLFCAFCFSFVFVVRGGNFLIEHQAKTNVFVCPFFLIAPFCQKIRRFSRSTHLSSHRHQFVECSFEFGNFC